LSEAPISLLRPGLLGAVKLLLAVPAEGDTDLATAVRGDCESLGAACELLELDDTASAEEQEQATESAVAASLESLGAADALIVDAGAFFADGGPERLLSSMQASWSATRAFVAGASLAQERPGRVIYLAPPPQQVPGGHAEAALAGLENLARTLSIEWARRAITTVTLAPARDTPTEQIAAICAYLLSPAGEYFSGCLLDLRGPG
jgi:NAD(P)-dependent dehydrogenase (short-subunit alcohol dehydrogenase family)